MSDVYIVGYDGSEASDRALQFAIKRAERSGARLYLLMVLEWSPFSFHTPEELAERHKRRGEEVSRAEAILTPVLKELEAKGVKVAGEVHHGNAAELICEAAKTHKADQIIIGRTGSSSLAERILGGMVLNLVQAAPVPVTVVP